MRSTLVLSLAFLLALLTACAHHGIDHPHRFGGPGWAYNDGGAVDPDQRFPGWVFEGGEY